MADWDVVLRDRMGGFLADVTVPFKVRRAMNEATHVSFTADHEDELAAKLHAELPYGIPQVALWRNGVLWARGWWHPMEETAGADGTQMACVFRGPFAEMENMTLAKAYKKVASYPGQEPQPITADQGIHLRNLAGLVFGYSRGLRTGSNVLSVTRDRSYPVGKNRAEAVMQLTEVINGAEFLERPVDYLTAPYGGKTVAVLAELDTSGRFGTNKSGSVIFEHGFGAANVLTVNRQIGRPVNYVIAKGAEYAVESGTFKGTYRRVATALDTASRDKYGEHEAILDLPDVVDVATLAEHAKGALNPDPPQAITFTPDASGDLQPTNYWIGDTIRLVVDRGALQIDMTARILAVEIEVDAEGNETHTLEIGERRAAPLLDMLRGLARAQRALARHETPQA